MRTPPHTEFPRPAAARSDPDFAARVYWLIGHIPRGRVATYGQIAQLAGFPRRARHVGRLLAQTPLGLVLPWHRVITAQGRVAERHGAAHACGAGGGRGPVEVRQMRLLKREGVAFKNKRVDLSKFRWRPEEASLDPADIATIEESKRAFQAEDLPEPQPRDMAGPGRSP